jgi:hypothetical protein
MGVAALVVSGIGASGLLPKTLTRSERPSMSSARRHSRVPLDVLQCGFGKLSAVLRPGLASISGRRLCWR